MAYLKPPFVVRRIVNPLVMLLGLGGTDTLTVVGRVSGEPRSVPVVSVEYGGTRYLVSARGETEWVRNLRTAGMADLKRRRKTEQIVATEVPLAERPPIIERYRAKAGRAVAGPWQALPDPADHPTFRLDPA